MRAEPLLLAALAATGCSTVCKGPGCADSYAAERLSLLEWTTDLDDTLDPLTDAVTRFDGSDSDGTDWFATPGPPGTLLIGMPDAGRVVRVNVQAGTSGIQPDLEIVGPDGFGASIANVDLDGDGDRDLLIGAPDAQYAAGAVYVFLGAGTPVQGKLTASEADFVIQGTSTSDHLGAAIYPCADLTGDGLPEVLVTAPWLEVPPDRTEEIPSLAGAVFLLESELLANASGNTSPWDLGRIWWGNASGDRFGSSALCRADLTGDRQADLAFGAPYAGDEVGKGGRVYLVSLDGRPLPESGPIGGAATAVLASTVPDAWFGTSLAAAEYDRDTPLDLVVGSPGAHKGTGRVEIYRGSDLFRGPSPWRVIRNSSTRSEPDHLGRTLATGDLDGDTADDLVVGAPDWYGGGNAYDTGAVFVWTGVAIDLISTFTVTSAEWTVTGTDPFQRVGRLPHVLPARPSQPGALLLATRTTPPDAD